MSPDTIEVLVKGLISLVVPLWFVYFFARLWKMRKLSKEEQAAIISRSADGNLRATRAGIAYFLFLFATLVLGIGLPLSFPQSEAGRFVAKIGMDLLSLGVFLFAGIVLIVLQAMGIVLFEKEEGDPGRDQKR